MSDQIRIIEANELLKLPPDPDRLLVQVTSPEVYANAHLPGAVLVTPPELVCGVPPATGKLPSPDQLTQLFTRLGYREDLEIVVYDDEGGGWAGRLAWTLDIIGHRRWTYLNGGMHAWASAGGPFEQQPNQATATEVNLTLDAGPIAEIADVLAAMEDDHQAIWDVRSQEEYLGLRQAAARVGHIPGAVNWDWMYLKNPADAMRLNPGIKDKLAELGLADKRLITHCQTHHRSGLSYMVGRLLGLDIRAYHGSWSEWGNRDDTPIELTQTP